ncbi:hypothetical protein IE077_001110 [Cardiosporidium cionae]|uniref:Uncharacterized protein n=1 Tax=Cardiosporidium cionae TaxID=476202 RepID=A0ABQ7JG99_9APIC|nr:hypothetical protein IE077_001110 [Cardiosporidium cionae]|eukprot:KAF8823041.1 hypothetical protein IE077_001110 [Cardiosporidium cionae]
MNSSVPYNVKKEPPPFSNSRFSLAAACSPLLSNKLPRKSKKLMELSAIHNGNPNYTAYPPICLPFISRAGTNTSSHNSIMAVDRTQAGMNSFTPSKRPSVQNVDEANQNAAEFFNEMLDRSKNPRGISTSVGALPVFLHLQLPSILPQLDKSANAGDLSSINSTEYSKDEKKIATDSYTPKWKFNNFSSFEELPEGRIGKLVIFRSGKVKLKSGCHTFDVNCGSGCSFAQDVGCHFEGNSEFLVLGKCQHRIILTPDIEAMMRNLKEKEK